MCHYTVKFFECDHKTDDNVQGCAQWKKSGTHCDIDNPEVKKRPDCSIHSEHVLGLCPKCQKIERARIEREEEEELFRRDLEKAKRLDQEEQRRNAEAHEAHLRRVQEESMKSYRSEYQSKKVTEIRSTTTTTRTSSAPPPPPPPPPARAPTVAAPPPPPPPPPARASTFPADFSQPPKEQKLGHYYVGTRRQPIHPSQEIGANNPTPPQTPTSPQKVQQPVRLGGGVLPASPASPSSPPSGGFAGIPTGNQRGRLRPTPKAAPQEQGPSELEALWNRRGIQRETDEDEDDGITNATVSPSESASQMSRHGSSSSGYRNRGL